MHILIATDQHPESLGGAQVSIRLQKRYLEKAGHTVSVLSAGMRREHADDPGYIDLPSVPITFDREYSLSLPGRRTDKALDAAVAVRGPVDVVHVQGDFWGALVGLRFAQRHRVPVVLTFHNNLEFGISKTMPVPGVVTRFLLRWQEHALGGARSVLRRDAWRYLNELALRADAVTAPSHHFAAQLRQKGVATEIDIVRTGTDDELIDEVLARAHRHEGERPLLVWMGRMSHEKRVLEFLEAVKVADIDAEIRLYGQGLLLAKAREFATRNGLAGRIVFAGKVPYSGALTAIASADALVQTSIGFETQGMTVFEAAALGTLSIVSDPKIAAELPDGVYVQPADDSVEALAAVLAETAANAASDALERPSPSASEQFRQSFQTARMIEIYERVTRG
ncbi:Glycosyltransferase involved in cell wall bisynthesis [Paramicrobacterium humi]|uniref:D-inositol 3-phosphate glycosyltransferase n=1 Tax=Paramicrobacterium humi TaxID=640635 RepID=A0A1H4M2A8_9MICO|nr:glycosyltransferase [Microbacterium humi]SEB77171.1 Glycosyltransferase involved in cell wall bisynthesis [Microbacterium humi]